MFSFASLKRFDRDGGKRNHDSRTFASRFSSCGRLCGRCISGPAGNGSWDPHSVTLKITHINENQQLNSTFLQGGSSNLYNTLETFRATASYVYDHTYSLTAAYFSAYGSADAGLFSATSLANSPDGKGLIFDLAYSPFMKGGPSVWPWLNARIGVSYTHYLELFGGVNNFDGAFHNASQNNTIFAYTWIAF